MPIISGQGGGGAGGGVASVTAADTSVVVGGTPANPTVRTNTLDVIATDHPPAADWSNNAKKITALANGTLAQDAAAFGQIPTVFAVNRKPTGNVTILDGYSLVAVSYYTPGGVLTLQGDAVLQVL